MKSLIIFFLLSLMSVTSFAQPCVVTEKWGDSKPIYSTLTGKSDTGYFKVWNEKGQYGVVSANAELVVPMLYDDDFETTGNLLVAKNRNKKLIELWDLVKKSKVKLPGVNGNTAVGSNGLIAIEAANRKWGFCDVKGKLILPFKYDYAFAFVRDKVVVMMGEKFGVINEKGVVMMPFKFNDLYPVGDQLLVTRIDSKDGATSNYGSIDYQGKQLVPEIYHQATQRDGILEFKKQNGSSILYSYNGKALTDSNVRIPSAGNSQLRVEDGRIAVIGGDGKWFILDTNGKKYLTDKYYFLYTPQSQLTKKFTDVYLFATQPGEAVKYGVVKLDGTLLLPDIYEDIIAATENRFYAKLPGKIKFSLMGADGKAIATDLCDKCIDFFGYYLIAKRESKYGVINSLTGEVVVPFVYDTYEMPNHCFISFNSEQGKVQYDRNFRKL